MLFLNENYITLSPPNSLRYCGDKGCRYTKLKCSNVSLYLFSYWRRTLCSSGCKGTKKSLFALLHTKRNFISET